MLLAVAIAAGIFAAGSVIPTPARTLSRVLLAFLIILLPILAAAYTLTLWDRATFATYLALFPLTFVWLAFIDLRWGISARLARRAGRTAGRRE